MSEKVRDIRTRLLLVTNMKWHMPFRWNENHLWHMRETLTNQWVCTGEMRRIVCTVHGTRLQAGATGVLSALSELINVFPHSPMQLPRSDSSDSCVRVGWGLGKEGGQGGKGSGGERWERSKTFDRSMPAWRTHGCSDHQLFDVCLCVRECVGTLKMQNWKMQDWKMEHKKLTAGKFGKTNYVCE